MSRGLRAIALGAPLALAGALALAVVHLVGAAGRELASGPVIEQALRLGAATVVLLGGATALALPVALVLVARERRVSSLVARWAALPPILSGLVVGWTFAASRLRWGWACALAACALAVLPRLVAELGASIRDRRAAVLIDAALALGARRPAALRLAFSGDAALWRSVASAVAVAAGDGVAALAAVVVAGASTPGTAELALLRAGAGEPDGATLAACAVALFVLAAGVALRRPQRVRRRRAEASPAVALLADAEGARS